MSEPLTTVRRRPKDRKAQILEAARALIGENGYANVSMAMIADQVGITAGALYRHFANKGVLLGAVIEQSFSEMTLKFGDSADLADVLRDSCTRAVAHRDVGALWWREGRHLPADDHERLRGRLIGFNRRYAKLISARRPTLSAPQAQELAWGVQAILAGTGSHTTRIAGDIYLELLVDACLRLCQAELEEPKPPTAQRQSTLSPVSRREALLGHAIELFERNGYEDTGLDDIGAAAGVTGPNLYSYYDNKAALLDAVVERGTSALWLLLHQVLGENAAPGDALASLVRGYTGMAVNKTIPASLLVSSQRAFDHAARVRQREYIAEWTALTRGARPELDPVEARALVNTALSVIHTLARIDDLRARPASCNDIAAMCVAILLPA
ncbi:TetR/AcrR family transcriptional regulator [Gordonia rubripertincta]|uniref:TetR/AcrR family transcriptional regulator n=1 Tax=Gordonia rubripertincta TaxID=36822 RepID=A0AAW4FZE0_GORRU|nr:TetR/AcrR family transcriptional regulator [Gordonia rubripertincta]MBM7276370.1 TetR/AcrR family transcriptional regulator [Gordonia rubripertincta]